MSDKVKPKPKVADAMKILRQYMPKRLSELIALVAVSTTVFLFLHTRSLSQRLDQIRKPYEEYDGSSGESGSSFAAASSERKPQTRELNTAPEPYYGKLDPNDLNNTKNAKKEILFFNRVPKVGSQTAMELMKTLSVKNNFHYHKDRTQKVETIKLTYNEEHKLAEFVNSFRPPATYVKHVCYANFTRFNLPDPIYINLVRDPVERVISWYYYVRAPWYFVERKRAFPDLPLPNPNWLRKDFETCVRTSDPECRYIQGAKKDGFGDHRRQTMFFCGHTDDCTGFNTEIAMRKAKENVEKHYAVVGLLEDLNKTLTVLEHYVPRFFKGALDTYYKEIKTFSKINRNTYKPTVPEEVKDIVRRNFTRELEFYDFCKQRLHKQYLALNLDKKP